jgi:hypothetical protein
MTDSPTFSADLPELVALAQMASVAPSAMAAGFSDPANLFQHISLGELARIKESTDRLAVLGVRLAKACDGYIAYAERVLNQPGVVS